MSDDRRYYGLDALRGDMMKFTAVAGVTTVVCFCTYHYWVQDGWVGRFLNGKRFKLKWPWRAT
jgi:hypothetical protein